MSGGKAVLGSLFFYAPNTAAAMIFAVAYGISTIAHLWQSQRSKSWSTTGLLPFCGLCFTAGFAVRAYCSLNYDEANPFIATQFIIYATAPILELANFHILGRILYYVPYLSPIHPGRVLSTFLMLSCVVEVLNALGVMQSIAGTLIGTKTKTPEQAAKYMEHGHALMKSALILQLVFAVCFVALAAVFHRRCLKRGIRNRKVTTPILTLYVSMALITGRTIYRTIEHFAFEDLSYSTSSATEPAAVVRYEWYFMVFEASLMFLALAVFNISHPGNYLPANSKMYLAQDGLTELEGPGWNDERPFIVTLCDPFNFAGCMDRTRGKKFWDDNGYQFPSQPTGDCSMAGSSVKAPRIGAFNV